MSAQAEQTHDRRVAFIGDSLVAGVGDPKGMGWVGRVVAASFGLGLPLTAYNLGVRRETSEQVSVRSRTESVPRLLLGTDARVVLSFGANRHDCRRGAASRGARALLRSPRRDTPRRGEPGAALLMVGPAPVDDPEQNERIRSLADALADVCERAGTVFVSVVEPLLASRVWMTQVVAGDGAHPAAEGYKVLSDLVIAAGWADWLRGA